MSCRRYGWLFGALLLAGTVAADPPLMPPAGQKAEDAKTTADAALAPTDPTADAKQVVLSYAKYKELLDEIARLKAKVKPIPPAKCRLFNGRVEGGLVFFTAEFGFHAERPDAVFALACGQAKALSAQQQPDGRTPLISSDQDGFQVQVEKPGDYQVSLDLSLPLSQRPGGKGLQLDLPRAVVTKLEMDLPADARAPRLGGKELSDTSLTFKNGHLDGPLGPADKLDLSWQGAPPPGVGPLQTARGRVQVRIQDGWISTEAELLLHAQGGPVNQWVLNVPAGAEVKAAAADQPRVQSINRADERGGARYTVVLKEPSDDDLTLTATVRAPLPDGKRAAVGPFVVRGASRQYGVVLIGAPAQDARLVFHPQPELVPRDLSDDERRADPTLTAAYDYGAVPSNLPWLEVEAGSAHGTIKTQVAYALALGRTGEGGAMEWQVTTTLTASPLFQTTVDHIDLQLPPDCEFVSSPPPDEVLSVDWDKDARVVHVKLADKPTGPFTVPIRARYTKPVVGPVGQAVSLPLPRPLDTRDGGGRIDVTVPDEVELLPPQGAEPAIKEAHKLGWPVAGLPEKVVLSWQPYHPETHASSVIDVTLHGPTAEVRQELRLRFPRTAPPQIALRTPAVLGDSLQILDGGQFLDDPAAAPATRTVRLQGNGQEQTLRLKYAFPTTEKIIAVPLATADQSTEGETRVRVWSDSGQLPLPPDGADNGWAVQSIELVKGVDRLPVLVLRRLRPDAPLSLRLDDVSGASAAVLVDRVLYRAARADGVWQIRASYMIRQIAEPTLDVELPAAPSALGLRVALDGKQVEWQAVVESEQGGPVKHLARLRLAVALFRRPAVLDVDYQMRPGQTEVAAARETLRPPLLVGDLRQAPTRWAVTLPPGDVALGPEGGAAVRRTLAPRGWLLAPQLAVTGADLEHWFAGSDAPARTEGFAAAPDVICWQEAGEPLVLTYVPKWGWLLVCSLPLLLLGVFLSTLARQSYAGRPRAAFWFWLTVVALVPAAAAVWAFRPTIFYAIAYGCEPGAVVLLLALAFQWALLERYRRQIVFLPSFRRARTGSSLVRANGARRPAGEPSTVDAPRPSGSSQQHA